MSEPQDPFERELADRLEALVYGEAAPLDLVDRASTRAGELAHRRRVRRGLTGAGLAALGAAAVWVLAVSSIGGNGGHPLQTGDGDFHPSSVVVSSTSSSSSSSTSSTSTTVDDGTPRTTTTLVGGTISTLLQPDAAPERKCFDATGKPNAIHDEWESGEIVKSYWKTQPPQDKPASVHVCVDDITPKVGQVVSVTIVGDDPDQPIPTEQGACSGPSVTWGDENLHDFGCDGITPPPETPRDTPEPGTAGHVESTSTHAYAAAGTFTIRAGATSGQDTADYAPYKSSATVEVPVAVHA